MKEILFVATLSAFYTIVFAWGFTNLPTEGWQILAVLPRQRMKGGDFAGRNVTFYGVFNAWAYTMGTAMMLILLGASGVPSAATLILAGFMTVLCVPASRWVAVVVEKRRHTATVGGATFVGIILAPWGAWLCNVFFGHAIGFYVPVMDALAAMAVAYSLGEGTGRLACVSFGCCYGKRVSECHPLIHRISMGRHFIFEGGTKKIAYEGGMEGVPVVPVQALTAVIYVASALAGAWFFLTGKPASAYVGTVAVTQVWRLLSEFLRADYRGEGRLSAYQWMGMIGVVYAVSVGYVLAGTSGTGKADVTAGLLSLWDPWVIIFVQVLWIAIFVLTGRSTVTGSTVSLHVIREPSGGPTDRSAESARFRNPSLNDNLTSV